MDPTSDPGEAVLDDCPDLLDRVLEPSWESGELSLVPGLDFGEWLPTEPASDLAELALDLADEALEPSPDFF